MQSTEKHNNDIAVIGIAIRFPGANDIETFWANLTHGKDCVCRYTDQELLDDGVDKHLIDHPDFVKASYKMDDIEYFDPVFFKYTDSDARLTDPQSRIFLECAWEALETCGYGNDVEKFDIGVFSSSYVPNYLLKNLIGLVHEKSREDDEFYTLYQAVPDYMSTNTSYRLNLKGPSVSIQSWCTSALSAIHFGMMSLRNYDCDMAVAGGVHLRLPQKGYFRFNGGKESIDGTTRFLDDLASGSVPGSGAAVLILKRSEDAIRDNDHIWAFIKNSSIMNDGASKEKMSFNTASVEGQQQIIEKVLYKTNVDIHTLRYFELQGNATKLGDRKEFMALSDAFKKYTGPKNYCAIGSVTPNIGHLGNISGLAGLIKTILVLKYRKIPPLINLTTLNKHIDLDNSSFYVNKTLQDIGGDCECLRAGLISYGIGGTYVSCILEASPQPSSPRIGGNIPAAEIMTISANSRETLKKAGCLILDYLELNRNILLQDFAFSVNTARKQHKYRFSFVFNTYSDIKYHLSKLFHEGGAALLSPDACQDKIDILLEGIPYDALPAYFDFYRDNGLFKKICNELWYEIKKAANNHENSVPKHFPDFKALESGTTEYTHLNFCLQAAFLRFCDACKIEKGILLGRNTGLFTLLYYYQLYDIEKIITFFGQLDTLEKTIDRENVWINFLENEISGLPYRFNQHIIDHLQPCYSLDKRDTSISQRHISYSNIISTGRYTEKGLCIAFSEIWQSGISINWKMYYSQDHRQRIIIPPSPLEKRKLWLQHPISTNDTNYQVTPVETNKRQPVNQETVKRNVILLMSRLLYREVNENDNFFIIGGNSLICMMLISRLQYEYREVCLSFESVFKHPTPSGLSAYITNQWGEKQDTILAIQGAQTITESYIKQYITDLITHSHVFNHLQSIDDLSGHLNELIPELSLKIKRDFNIPLYKHEFERRPKLTEMVSYLYHEINVKHRPEDRSDIDTRQGYAEYLDNWIPAIDNNVVTENALSRGSVFILSSQRSGSTLLRLILNKHSDIFCPPETGLFLFNNMKEWEQNFNTSPVVKDGLVYTLKGLNNYPMEQARKEADRFISGHATTLDVFRYIQDKISPKLLVDKCPDYSYQLNILKKIDYTCHQNKYLVLFREPYAVIESFVRHRFHKVMKEIDINPYHLAEEMWYRVYSNILTFIAGIDPSRYHVIRYEDLTGSPEEVLRDMCRFLSIEYEPGLVEPYENNSLIVGSGDPDIFLHKQIYKPSEEINKDIYKYKLSDSSLALARKLGYDIKNNPVTPPLNNISAISEQEMDKLMQDIVE